MEKRAIIHEDWTPLEEKKPKQQKKASQDDLEDSPAKRLADKVEASVENSTDA